MKVVLGVMIGLGGLPLCFALLLQRVIGPELGWAIGLFVLLGALFLLMTWTETRASSTRSGALEQGSGAYPFHLL